MSSETISNVFFLSLSFSFAIFNVDKKKFNSNISFNFFSSFFGWFLLFLLIFRRRSRKMQSLNQHKSPLPIAGLPVNCCGPNGSPGPLGSIATLSAFNHHKVIKNDSFTSRIGRYRKVKSTQL